MKTRIEIRVFIRVYLWPNKNGLGSAPEPVGVQVLLSGYAGHPRTT